MMEEILPIHSVRVGRRVGVDGKPPKRTVSFFDRHELQQILNTYSRKVMAGEWLDYAIRADDGEAVFSVYGKASAIPLFNLHKQTRSSKRGRYAVTARGRVLKMDPSLGAVLRVMEAKRPSLVHSGTA